MVGHFRQLLERTCKISNVLVNNEIKFCSKEQEFPDIIAIVMSLEVTSVACVLACGRLGLIHWWEFYILISCFILFTISTISPITNLLTLTQYLNDGEYFTVYSKIINGLLLSVISLVKPIAIITNYNLLENVKKAMTKAGQSIKLFVTGVPQTSDVLDFINMDKVRF